MKNFLTLFALLPIFVFSQSISVSSFSLRENDLDARINHPTQDQNGEKCAIIKVVTTDKGFVWEGDALGIVDAPYKTSEYWLFVPHGAKKLTIKHPELGMLRDYLYPIAIKEATVYEMVLASDIISNKNETVFQWLVLTSNPSGANLYINNEFKGTTPFQQEFPEGEYNYRVENPGFKTEAGKLILNAIEGKKIMDFNLKNDYGNIMLKTEPELEAKVFVDGELIGELTPCTIKNLKSGEHEVTVQKNMFKPTTQMVLVEAEKTTDATILMDPNFGLLKLYTENDAEIFIDGLSKGVSKWEGNLIAGYHTVEARKDIYKSDKKKIEIIVNKTIDLSLHPQPQHGKLKIVSNPFNASIKINNKEYGNTPITIDSLLIGNYTIELFKVGYKTIKNSIEIKEDEVNEFNVDMEKGLPVSFSSIPEGASIIIDEIGMGLTPCVAYLDTGYHKVILEKENYKIANRNINVSENVEKNKHSVYLIGKIVNVKVNTQPPGAKLWINGQLRGKTNLSYSIKAGVYEILIRKNGYEPIVETIEFNQNNVFEYELKTKD